MARSYLTVLVVILGLFGYALLSEKLVKKQYLLLLVVVIAFTCDILALRFYGSSSNYPIIQLSNYPIIILAIFTILLGGMNKLIWNAGAGGKVLDAH